MSNVLLSLLDLSAAFDIIDYNILIKCLLMWYGMSDTAELVFIILS